MHMYVYVTVGAIIDQRDDDRSGSKESVMMTISSSSSGSITGTTACSPVGSSSANDGNVKVPLSQQQQRLEDLDKATAGHHLLPSPPPTLYLCYHYSAN